MKETVKCPLCNLGFETGDVAWVVDGRMYHPRCLLLNEKLTNAKGQLGEKSLLWQYRKVREKKPAPEPAPESVDSV
jgi:hypothetical protein